MLSYVCIYVARRGAGGLLLSQLGYNRTPRSAMPIGLTASQPPFLTYNGATKLHQATLRLHHAHRSA